MSEPRATPTLERKTRHTTRLIERLRPLHAGLKLHPYPQQTTTREHACASTERRPKRRRWQRVRRHDRSNDGMMM
jgi:hypothetical protein